MWPPLAFPDSPMWSPWRTSIRFSMKNHSRPLSFLVLGGVTILIRVPYDNLKGLYHASPLKGPFGAEQIEHMLWHAGSRYTMVPKQNGQQAP